MKKTNTHSHLSRLDKLTSLLKSDDFLTAKDLSKALGISTRTLYRDINLLRERGLPIDADKGRGGGIKLHQNWGIGRLNLSNSETVDLLISLAIAQKMNSSLFMENLKSIHYKLLALLSPKQKLKINKLRERIRIGTSASPLVLESFELSEKQETKSLSTAFIYQKKLHIKYEDENKIVSTRQIEPHYLYLNYPVWYIFAWDHLRNDFRTFRCDRILNSRIEEGSFKLRHFDDFLHMLRTDLPVTL